MSRSLLSSSSEKMKFLTALIALQFCYAGFHIVTRFALDMGVSKIVYPVYRNIIALALLSPFAYFLEKKERPPITFHFLVQCFLLALCGITANQGFYILGLYYASPTFASAMQNSVPAITFVMAAALRLESVSIARRDGIAKILGTIASVGGAMVITLYKGPALLHSTLSPFTTSSPIENQNIVDLSYQNKQQNWTLGCLFLVGHCFSWAAWMVFQAPVLKKYPAKLTVTSFTCFFGLLQFLVIAAFAETDIEKWKFQSTGELLTILYAGVVASGLVLSIQTWCIHKGGPVSVAVFQPLQTVLVAIMAALVLGDQLYSGGIIGAIFIMIGLWLVLWGKKQEKKWENSTDNDNDITKTLLDEESRGKMENTTAISCETK
ncbi:hypothetical protein C5167_023105 [Papaver somniferum]|uniref:WAT1-related protein n=1 Tax=Papaver somniferum TaxID=3469 RepID=A0A4Y7JNH9_PAPSO|nr:WAT1-related protein At3g18200-like [Papaver somniferum]RZC61348.1 hypothetical protein C5167_023105 [Papaver somniferum]